MGTHWNTAIVRYGSYWRDSRKLFSQGFHPQAIARYRPAELNTSYKFLRDLMWDKEEGGFYWRLDREGNLDDWKGVKHAYGVSFGIYACSAYYRASQDPQAMRLAMDAFHWLDRIGHDADNGGYDEYFNRRGVPIVDVSSNPLGVDRDAIGTRVGLKSMNTHIHLLEASAARRLAAREDATVSQIVKQVARRRTRSMSPADTASLYLASRSAVSAVIPRLPCTISLIRRGGTLMDTASLFCVMPKPSMKSSMSTSPGWIGSILSVVVNDLHLLWSGGGPHEADPPLVVDPDAVLPDPTALERLEPIARRDAEVLERLCRPHLT